MYWLYFFLLVIAISTPIFIEGESLRISEDMRESALILVAGALGFLLYILKEKAVLKYMREKLWFQQKNSTITKDLSQSYSYIGEVNRKVDILKGMMHRLTEILDASGEKERRMLWEILDTIKHLTQAESVSLRTFSNNVCVNRLEENGDKKIFSKVSDEALLKNEKKFFEIEGIQGVAAERSSSQAKIFLLLFRKHNEEIDADILSILMDFLLILEKSLSRDKESI